MIKNLFNLENYEDANKKFQSLIYREKEFYPMIYKIIRKSIPPRYKNFIYHLKDKKIEKTSDKIENAFQKNHAKIQKNEHSRQNPRVFKTNIQKRFNLEP